jgi:hypothetical protein
MEELDLGQTIRGFAAGQIVFGRYVLRSILGRGGMGIVWRAFDEHLERDVALKFLPDLIIHDRAVLEGLKKETKRSLELTHPHIVRIHDFVQDSQSACISMEYVDGETLSSLRLEKESQVFEPEDLKRWMAELCEALSYAHIRARIVHRDLKPSNLMVNSKGELKIADFGIARSLADSVSLMTMTRGTSGTLVYMSPQQLDGERASHLDDIYSVGATLYELLTGKPPFYSGNIDRQVREKLPPSIAQRRIELEIETQEAVLPQWEETIATCLAKEPAKRPQTVEELSYRLGIVAHYTPAVASPASAPARRPGTITRTPNSKRRKFWVASAIAGLLLIGAATWWFAFENPRRIQMAFARGEMELATDPSGVVVSLDGQEKGRTPFRLNDLPVRKYKVRLAMPGFDPIERRVSVEQDTVANPGLIKMYRSHGTLAVQSEPPGANYEVNLKEGPVTGEAFEVKKGVTPASLDQLPSGTYELIFRKEGWPEQKRSAVIEAGKTASARVDFVTGFVRVESQPPGATVWGSGTELGKTPVRLELKPGEHELEVRLAGFASGKVRVHIEGKKEITHNVALEPRRYGSPRVVLEEYAKLNLAEAIKPDLPALRVAIELALASPDRAKEFPVYWERTLRVAESLSPALLKQFSLKPSEIGTAFGELLELPGISKEDRYKLLSPIQKLAAELPASDALQMLDSLLPHLKTIEPAAAAPLRKLAANRLATSPEVHSEKDVYVNVSALLEGLPSEDKSGFLRLFVDKLSSIRSAKARGEILRKIPASIYLTDPERTKAFYAAILSLARSPGAFDAIDIQNLAIQATGDGDSAGQQLAALLKADAVWGGEGLRKKIAEAQAKAATLQTRRLIADGKFEDALRELRSVPQEVRLGDGVTELISAFRKSGDLLLSMEIVRRAERPISEFRSLVSNLVSEGHYEQAESILNQVPEGPNSSTKFELLADLAIARLARADFEKARALAGQIPAGQWSSMSDSYLLLLAELNMGNEAAAKWESTSEAMRAKLTQKVESSSLSSFPELYISALWLKWTEKIAALDAIAAAHPGLFDSYRIESVVEGALLAGRPDVAARWRARQPAEKDSSLIRTVTRTLAQRHADAHADALLASLNSDRQRAQFWQGISEALLNELRSPLSVPKWTLPFPRVKQATLWVGKNGAPVALEEGFDLAVTTAAKFPPGSKRAKSFLYESAVSAARTGRVSVADEILARMQTPTARFDAITEIVDTEKTPLSLEKIREYLDAAEKLVPSLNEMEFGNVWAKRSGANTSLQAHALIARLTKTRLSDSALANRRFQRARGLLGAVPVTERYFSARILAVRFAEAGMFDSARETAKQMTTFGTVNPAICGAGWTNIAQEQVKIGDSVGAAETLRIGEEHLRSAAKKFQNPSDFIKRAMTFFPCPESVSSFQKFKSAAEAIEGWKKESEEEEKGMPLEEARASMADFVASEDTLAESGSPKSISESDFVWNDTFFKALRGLLKSGTCEEVAECARLMRIGTNLNGDELERAEIQRAKAIRMAGQRFHKDNRSGEARAWIEQMSSDLEKAFAWLGVSEGPPPNGF